MSDLTIEILKGYAKDKIEDRGLEVDSVLRENGFIIIKIAKEIKGKNFVIGSVTFPERLVEEDKVTALDFIDAAIVEKTKAATNEAVFRNGTW